MKRFGIALAILVLAVMAAAVIGPSFVDWNAYRKDIAGALGKTIGREVAIDGDLKLAVVPFPYLSARDVRVASFDGAVDAQFVSVSELRMRIGVGPLLRGRIAVTSLDLVAPRITFESTTDGQASWQIAPGETAAADAQRPPAEGSDGIVGRISINTVSITDGTLIWRAPARAVESVEGVTGEVIAASGLSPHRLTAQMRYRNLPVDIAATIGQPRTGNATPVSALVDLAGKAAVLELRLAVDEKEQTAQGTARLAIPDLAALERVLTPGEPPVLPARELTLETPLQASREQVKLTGYEIRVGDMRGAGSLELRAGDIPEIAVSLSVPVLDLDTLLTGGNRPSQQQAASAAGNEAGSAGIAVPEGIKAAFDISAGTVRLRNGLLHDARLMGRLDSGVVELSTGSVRLPGGTLVSLSGRTARPGKGPAFSGDLAAAADNVRAALAWAGVDEAALPVDRLRGFSYTSRLAVTDNAVELNDITARFDATRLTGAATIARRARPSFGARLALDRIRVDDYLPKPGAAGPGQPVSTAKPVAGSEGYPALGVFDANLDLSVNSLTWGNETASGVRLDAQLFKGVATIRRLAAEDMAGASVSVAGKISNIDTRPSAALTITAEGRDAARLARAIGIEETPAIRRIGKYRLDAQIAGTERAATVKGEIGSLGGKLAADGQIKEPTGNLAMDVSIAVDHPDTDKILALFDPTRSSGGLGPLSARLRLNGGEKAVSLHDVKARIGDMPLEGRVDIDRAGERPRYVASLAAGTVVLDKWFPQSAGQAASPPKPPRGDARWSRNPIDFSGLRAMDFDLALQLAALVRDDIRVENADIRANLSSGILNVNRFAGSAFGGGLDAAVSIDATGKTPRITARIAGSDMQARGLFGAIAGFDRLEGPVSLNLALETAGETELGLISALAGSGKITGTVKGRLTKQERVKAGAASVVAELLGSKVREVGAAGDAVGTLMGAFADSPAALSGDITIDQGRARTENLLLTGKGARAVTAGTANLAGWTIESATTLHRDIDAGEPYIVVRLKGPLDEPDIRAGGTWLKANKPAPPPAQPAPEVLPADPLAGQPAEQPVQPAPGTKPPAPDQFIRDILKTLKK